MKMLNPYLLRKEIVYNNFENKYKKLYIIYVLIKTYIYLVYITPYDTS